MPHAQRVAAQTGLDPRLVAAQAALESNYRQSAPGGNLFGIKGAGTGPNSTMESVNGQMVPTKASFASYDSPAASFDGYGKLMSGPRYAGVRGAQGLDAQIDAVGKSGYATDPNYAAKIGSIARGLPAPGQSAQADMPAPNATPTGSNSLPPGVTADMIGGSTASPYGGPPKPMSTANIVTAAMAKAGMDTSGLPGAAAPQPAPSPFGTLRPMSPPPAPAASPSPPAAPATPFGGPPQPMGQQPPSPQQSAVMAALLAAPPPNMASPTAPQPDPNATPSADASALSDPSDTPSSPQVAKSSGADPALMTQKPTSGATPIMPDGSAGPSPLLASQADPGASSMLPASPPLPPPGVQTVPQGNPFGGPPQPMPSPPAIPPAAMAAALAGGSPPVTAAPLSTDNLPGMDNFNSQGGVTQSSLGAAGFTGRDNAANPITAATQGNLPGPQAYVGGDMGLGTPLSAPLQAGKTPLHHL